MLALRAALGLWLVGTLGAFPQDRPLKAGCAGDPNRYYDEAAGACCYRCPPGQSPEKTQPCPQGPSDCGKQCEPDYYLSASGRCTACVSCLGDLVEKAPCSGNSPHVCQCRPGTFCSTSAKNSCARCSPHTVCPAGQVVQSPGTAEKDTKCGPPSPGTSPDCTSPEDCKTPARDATPQAEPILMTPATTDARTTLQRGVTPHPLEDASPLTGASRPPSSAGKPSPHPGVAERDTTYELRPPGTHPDCSTPGSSEAPASTAPTLSPLVDSHTSRMLPSSTVSLPSTGKPILDPGPMLFWVIMVLVLVVGSTFFLLCHQRACRRRFRQKLHLCHPAQPFPPKLEPVQPRSALETEPSTEEKSFVSPPAAETCVNVGAACPESLPLLDSSPGGAPSSPRDPPEPRVSTEHTNNKIEKIYIMKADTVIVGTVKTEASEGRGPVGPVGPEAEPEPELEADHGPHYPEQETEPPLGSCGDVMFSVEEEGKEDLGPTVASGK
uniref:TNF receptor superfamily member 8 n=1 Tax=Marmota marmota marmota TaxID=9994 RepID=A0A8C5ZQX1_MARMA